MFYVAGHHRSQRLCIRHAGGSFMSGLYHIAGGREATFYFKRVRPFEAIRDRSQRLGVAIAYNPSSISGQPDDFRAYLSATHLAGGWEDHAHMLEGLRKAGWEG
jgi:hypothetical protein